MRSRRDNKIYKDSLRAEIEIGVRFSEVDSMNIVWHGSYSLYFEEAREAFGATYGLGYLDIFGEGYYAPLVDLQFSYKRPLIYGDKFRVVIYYQPTEAAKIIFYYEIYSVEKEELMATGSSVQVFLDRDYQLVWAMPPFYERWRKKQGF